MERIERHEGEIIKVGGLTFAVVSARGGRVVMLTNTGMGETGEDCERAAARLRAKLDIATEKESTTH